jgi:hypothetical protein
MSAELYNIVRITIVSSTCEFSWDVVAIVCCRYCWTMLLSKQGKRRIFEIQFSALKLIEEQGDSCNCCDSQKTKEKLGCEAWPNVVTQGRCKRVRLGLQASVDNVLDRDEELALIDDFCWYKRLSSCQVE